jgi:hypothetical protein
MWPRPTPIHPRHTNSPLFNPHHQRPAGLQYRTLRRHPSPPDTPRRPAHPHTCSRVSIRRRPHWLPPQNLTTSRLPAASIATFEAGLGARMNWTKTFLYSIGAPGADDPPPSDPDPTDIPFNTDAIFAHLVSTSAPTTKSHKPESPTSHIK